MLIFLAGFAVLLVIAVLGQRAGTHLFHQGDSRYFDHCSTCDVRYPRLPGVTRATCPQGHPFAAVVAEPHHNSAAGTIFMALCAGFALVIMLLTITGVTPLP